MSKLSLLLTLIHRKKKEAKKKEKQPATATHRSVTSFNDLTWGAYQIPSSMC
jgi:hypothetical protein